MLKVGLTGGIGSGKSTVAKIFETLSIPVYYADDAARQIMNDDEELKAEIIAVFGADTYVNGILNRAVLGAKVFTDEAKLKMLNAIVHPAVIRAGETWLQQQTAPYAVKEAALFFESGSAGSLEFIIGVHAPEALRISRVMKRDKITRDEVMARMQRQISETVKMKLCDAVIINDEQNLVIPQVLALHKKFTTQVL